MIKWFFLMFRAMFFFNIYQFQHPNEIIRQIVNLSRKFKAPSQKQKASSRSKSGRRPSVRRQRQFDQNQTPAVAFVNRTPAPDAALTPAKNNWDLFFKTGIISRKQGWSDSSIFYYNVLCYLFFIVLCLMYVVSGLSSCLVLKWKFSNYHCHFLEIKYFDDNTFHYLETTLQILWKLKIFVWFYSNSVQ